MQTLTIFIFFFSRFGSDLVLVESYEQNNFTEHLAHQTLDHPTNSYWLGLVSLNDLSTNTLESAGGQHVSLYSGEYCSWLLLVVGYVIFYFIFGVQCDVKFVLLCS